MVEYHYIIVGGGTSGLVLANRLTEDPNIHVLVLEAGGDKNNDPKIMIPGLATSTYSNPEYDWSFRSTPQEHLHNKTVDLTRGKLLGGSSAINILALIYPHRSTFDAWEKDLGNVGWGWDDISPYYNKAFTLQDPKPAAIDSLGVKPIERSLHGDTGPVKSSYASFVSEPPKTWLPTFRNLGLEAKNDFRTGHVCGAYTSVATIDSETGERSHAGVAYHEVAKHRPNYHTITEALVEKIVLEPHAGTDATVQGVLYSKDGQMHMVKAKREVLLCAGAFQSPQLLELSGVGNPDILAKAGVDVIVSNPNVGENLQDHPLTGLCFEVKDGIATTDMIRDPAVVQAAMKMYKEEKTGPLASPFGGCAATLPVQEWTKSEARYELQAILDEKLGQKTPIASKLASIDRQYAAHRRSLENPDEGSVMFALGTIQMHFERELRKEVFALSSPENFIVILAALTSPLSRGSTHIKSSDPTAKPTIDPQYLAHPLDVEILGRQVRFIETIVKTEPLANILKKDGAKLPEHYDLSSVESAKEHVTKHTISNNHAASSCAMLPKELGGVVDTKLRVYGVKGLRVIDASIMPLIPKGNIQSTVYAVAEKAADMIKAEL